MTDIRRLDTLPLDVLILIFDYCTMRDLSRLSCTCKYFNNIMRMDVVWTKKSKEMLFTNQMSKRFRERCNPLLSSRHKCIVSQYWRCKNMKYAVNIYKVPKYGIDGYIQMTKDILWWSHGYDIRGFKRTGRGITTSDIIINETICSDRQSFNHYNDHLIQFVLCNEDIISSHEGGSIRKWVNGRGKTNRLSLARTYSDEGSDVWGIVATSQHIISSHSSRISLKQSESIKIRKHTNMSEETNSKEHTIPLNYIACSLAIDPTGTKLAVGCGTDENYVFIFDINNSHYRLDKICNFEKYYEEPASEIIWEDPHTLLTHDMNVIFKWDLRVGKCVCSWIIDNHLRCLSSDYQYTIMAGGAHGKVFAFDQRQRDCANIYCIPTLKCAKDSIDSQRIYNCIDSIEFDSNHLYASSDERLYEINFAEHASQNYQFSEIEVK